MTVQVDEWKHCQETIRRLLRWTGKDALVYAKGALEHEASEPERRQSATLGSLPVFMLSSRWDAALVTRSLDLKVRSFFLKPDSGSDLESIAEGILAHWYRRSRGPLARSRAADGGRLLPCSSRDSGTTAAPWAFWSELLRRERGTNTMISLLLAALAAQVVDVRYPPSTVEGELPYGVTYSLWIPGDVARIRGILVHQHGCGSGACKGGATAAWDLHWQALARKWDCALLGPSYEQEDGQDCRKWCDPRYGSEKTFFQALKDLAAKSKHPEIETAPWCLWGHSGGGTWSSLMMLRHPERVVAVWLRSGTAYGSWDKGPLPAPEIRDSVYGIPVMCNPGAKEKGDKRFNGAYTGTLAHFKAFREKGAPIAFAPDPRTSHETGDSRYLAIPWFDACLAARLPEKDGPLRPVDPAAGWLAEPLSESAVAAASYAGKAAEAVWLPNEAVAKAWMDYVKTGATGDATPPPAPTGLKAELKDGAVELTWSASADLESGLKSFIIFRDGQEIGRHPKQPAGKFGRPLFQAMSYHDTPEKPLPEMKFVDRDPAGGAPRAYTVRSVNSVDLRSEPSAPATPR